MLRSNIQPGTVCTCRPLTTYADRNNSLARIWACVGIIQRIYPSMYRARFLGGFATPAMADGCFGVVILRCWWRCVRMLCMDGYGTPEYILNTTSTFVFIALLSPQLSCRPMVSRFHTLGFYIALGLALLPPPRSSPALIGFCLLPLLRVSRRKKKTKIRWRSGLSQYLFIVNGPYISSLVIVLGLKV